MFSKILIANRGEIACRVIRSARGMGVGTVAVYSEADRGAKHVAMADEAVCIGGEAAGESYLDGGKIIAACRERGAEAVHPGYGFLSENAGFARKLEKAGIAFIGPRANAIEAMGDKITSRKLAEKAGVNVIPGHNEAVANAREAVKIAERIGYPVMLKASAGGGGKGMRMARGRAEVESGFARASSEALASFGDGRMFVEKYIEQPRHIEIQVLADSQGNVVALHERECSIQRRHQKVIEEAPSPLLDGETRAAMCAQAIALAKAVKYRSAGTVEMVVDAARNFYFLEMNTRLQVEHPVTEMITGLDLVEWMIRIANGEALGFTQEEVAMKGWAIESRVYAENSLRGGVPSMGRLVRYRPPAEGGVGDGCLVRVDDGVAEGDEISRFYDPMIAKVVAWGEGRAQAIGAMRRALDEYVIRGVETNLPLLTATLAQGRFAEGDLNTDFIAEVYPDGFSEEEYGGFAAGEEGRRGEFVAVAVWLHYRQQRGMYTWEGGGEGGDNLPDADGENWVALVDGEHYAVTLGVRGESGCVVRVGGGEVLVEVDGVDLPESAESAESLGSPLENQWLLRCRINGEARSVQVERLRMGLAYVLTCGGKCVSVQVLRPRVAELHALMPRKAASRVSQFLRSPMPGLLMSLRIKAGATVKEGEELGVVEAMKMENPLRAEHDGVVKKVLVEVGKVVEAGQPILEFAEGVGGEAKSAGKPVKKGGARASKKTSAKASARASKKASTKASKKAGTKASKKASSEGKTKGKIGGKTRS